MIKATNLGYPRIGANRELKKALEAYWSKQSSRSDLEQVAKSLRLQHWQTQKDAGIDHIPSNDFAFYDQVLGTSTMVGAVPERFGWSGKGSIDLDLYFAMARGTPDAPAMSMKKWFDTNYHYIVPELSATQSFALSDTSVVECFKEAKAAGIPTRPVLVGPVTYLLLSAMKDNAPPLDLLPKLLPVYERVFKLLQDAGAEWVQVGEPIFVLDQSDEARRALQSSFEALSKSAPKLKILLATYFDDLGENTEAMFRCPVAGVHIDLVRAPAQLDRALSCISADQVLSLGLIDGRNIWKANLPQLLATTNKAVKTLSAERVFVAPSCSLLHTPVDLESETALDRELVSWMSFAKQKLSEVVAIREAASGKGEAVKELFASSEKAWSSRRSSTRITNPEVQARMKSIDPSMLQRKSPFAGRIQQQRKRLSLPLFPTTTIGSFPQTKEIRAARADFKAGKISRADYETFLKKEIAMCVDIQEELQIDMLVHGEAERNDMVEYFGEQLAGFAFSKAGWVQSYGSRCVKPPLIYGDVSRPSPMTVEWSSYAQSLTKKPMKGMLSGPVTILQWSFVRDDQPRSATTMQIALALRDEVLDLERAGITAIQIDEPAIREGLPLRKSRWREYLTWAVDAFRLGSAGVADSTQIHTHMCYSDFNDIIESVAALDADVISIETSRSQMDLLDAFVNFKYPNEIGPGVYDIHSPRVVSKDEMVRLLKKAAAVLKPEQLWVNPDCGLKTRQWPETRECLQHMVEAAQEMRRLYQ